MLQRSLLSFVIIAVGCLSSSRADFTPIVGWDQQLFPAYIVATAAIKSLGEPSDPSHLGDPNGLLGVEITAPFDNAPIEVTVIGEEYFETSVFSGRLPEKGTTYTVFPKIRYRYNKLNQCQQATHATVNFQVKLGDQPTEETSTTLTIRSIHDCPLKIAADNEVIDVSFTFATYVNEQHPFVDKLLREALDIGVVDSFIGYQSKDPADVITQVYALWDLLVARDVRYSNITTTAADSDRILSQHVRLLEDSINNQQANCVDGSVLLVSMLRKIGIESFLVLEPGHCYVGFFLDEKQEVLLGLETTIVGAEVEEPEELDEFLDASIDEELRGEYSWPSFVQSIELATGKIANDADKFKSEDQHDYRFVDIAAARKAGVLPIAFDGKEVFVAFDHSEYAVGAEDEEDEEDEEDDEDDKDDEDEEEDEDE